MRVAREFFPARSDFAFWCLWVLCSESRRKLQTQRRRVISDASGTCSHASVLEKQSFRFVHVNFYININIRTFEHLQGEEFDSSYNRGEPTKFAPNQVIKGWTEAMQLMSEGDKWELVIPSELAYGDRAMGPQITPGSVLVFEMEIVKVGA